MPLTKKIVRDYYKVDLPSDFSEDREERGQQAIREAEEMSRIYALPCVWEAIADTGEMVTVRRKRWKQGGPARSGE